MFSSQLTIWSSENQFCCAVLQNSVYDIFCMQTFDMQTQVFHKLKPAIIYTKFACKSTCTVAFFISWYHTCLICSETWVLLDMNKKRGKMFSLIFNVISSVWVRVFIN